MRLQNKVAIVTGAASGIGKGIAESFVKEGAKVILCDVNAEGEKVAEALGANARFIQCDISNPDSVKNLVAQTLQVAGTIDILVNNAGICRQHSILESSDEEWDATINTNLKGPFLLSREVLPTFISKGRGKIVNIASIAGIIGFANLSPYCASKGGVIAMTRAMAIELASKKINVNCICPGAIKSGMTKGIEENPEILKQTLAGIPMGRIGEPADIANAALYLASDESDYTTGAAMVVDGGWSEI